MEKGKKIMAKSRMEAIEKDRGENIKSREYCSKNSQRNKPDKSGNGVGAGRRNNEVTMKAAIVMAYYVLIYLENPTIITCACRPSSMHVI